MSYNSPGWEAVIGLEIHVQLDTNGKLFSGESVEYKVNPNSLVSPYTLGLPGTLPVLNKKAVEKAVRLAVALRSKISPQSTFDRKNYFYPDLPKGYQITQFFNPLAKGGLIPLDYNLSRVIQIRQIHLEEDAGKTIHSENSSKVDYNRCGTPLAEIVTNPELRSPIEAVKLVKQIQKIVTYLDINSGIMAHGSIRCDANISVRKEGEFRKGKKVEIKNLNSLAALEKALDYEIIRQTGLLESGKVVKEDSRLWDETLKRTMVMRSKEKEIDYRYFPDPDVPPLDVGQIKIPKAEELPPLAHERGKRYLYDYGLNQQVVDILLETREGSDYFEQVIHDMEEISQINQAVKWFCGPIRNELKENKIKLSEYNITPERVHEFINLITVRDLKDSIAIHLFDGLKKSDKDVAEIYNEILEKSQDSVSISEKRISEFLSAFPKETKKYKEGKTNLIGFFVGEYMKKNPGIIDPGNLKNEIKKLLDRD